MKIRSNSNDAAFMYLFIILILQYIKFDKELFQFLYSTGKTVSWQFLCLAVFSLTRFEVIGL